ncbi:MAG: hypothetical protein JO356_19785, partial [Acidobacteria bacterium]|nr:hypothetical protein [Acidobacteriota bacterium]
MMRRTAFHTLGILLILAAGFTEVSLGQQPSFGTPPFGSFGGGPFDVINLGNLNVHFVIPINHKAGRGVPFVYGDLVYEGTIWQPVASGGTQSWQPITSIGAGSSAVGDYWGWQGLQNAGTPYIGYSMTTSSGQCGYPYTNQYWSGWQYSNFVYHDEKGVSHPFTSG